MIQLTSGDAKAHDTLDALESRIERTTDLERFLAALHARWKLRIVANPYIPPQELLAAVLIDLEREWFLGKGLPERSEYQ